MSRDISTSLPTEHSAGDTLEFKRYYSDFDPGTWTLTYYLMNSAGTITFGSSDNGDGYHLVDVAAATTASWTVGTYSLRGFVSDGTDRYQVDDGTIEILPDYAVVASYDDRSHACTMVDLLEAAMQSASPQGIVEVSINGRKVRYDDKESATQDYFKWLNLCKMDKAQEKINAGLASGYKIKTRTPR